MKHRILNLFAALFIFFSPAHAEMPNGEFIEVQGATAAVILAHGRGQGPNGKVVGPLRRKPQLSPL